MISFSAYFIFFSPYQWKGPDEKKFVITQGEPLNSIIDDLEKSGIISDRILFKLAVMLTFNESKIISKSYILKNGMSNYELVKILTDNTVRLVKITIPEGYTLKQIASLGAKKLALSEDKIYKAASDDSLINMLGLKSRIKNLEGFLFPDTYELSQQITEKEFIETLFDEFYKNVYYKSDIEDIAEKNSDSLLKIITLASIIEAETNIDEERAVISGVYHNRLKRNMKLEADPTVQYVIPGGPKQRLLFEDLKINSPYNTYLNKGLPPGPINNPGLKSIMAAMDPDDNKYIFFVATGEGGHRFSETYDQHLNAIKDYKKKLKENKIKKENGKQN
ncbi:MAG: endolytic transglycosylase MltG [Bacteroidetes bacterium]|nr:endolytic transglycosylase MltG [Bacteroidota bacterium]